MFEPPLQMREYGDSGKPAFIQRGIATPGERGTVTDHQVMVDGQPFQEDYVLELPNYLLGSITVPPGGLFVMGDNRNDSNDFQV